MAVQQSPLAAAALISVTHVDSFDKTCGSDTMLQQLQRRQHPDIVADTGLVLDFQV